jgi:exodeoxyribonuclease V gamma subunit
LRTLQQVLQQVQAPRTPAAWVQDLQRLVDAVLLAPTERDAKALMGLTAPLQAWLQACQTAALTTPVSLTLVRTHWLSSLSEMTAGQRFLGGGVQFATLLPMRSIPFQRVCLLGMNDGAYPRQQPLNDFDLMRAPAQRRPGDRSRREDDRYLFLEAVLCARQSLYISWQGWQAHDQSPLYPSVLVGQLIDHLNAAHEAPVPVQEAPMQAFSRQYFERPEGPWRTYATDWAWARGWQPKAKPAPVASSPAPVGSTESAPWPNALKLRDLIDLLRQPVEVFYRHRLGLRWQAPEQELPDAEPFELGAIDQHRLVAQALAHPDSFPAQARSSGQLPLGAMAQRPLQQLQSQIKVLNDRLHRSLSGAAWQEWPEQSLHWTAPSTTTSPVPALQATLGGPGWHLNEQGEILQTLLRPGVLMKKQVLQLHPLLTTWAQHLMANACGLPCTTHVLCLDQARVLPTLSTQRAGELLVKLLQAYQHAWSMPMAVPGRTACHWLAQVHKSSSRDEDERRLSAHGDSRGMYMGSRHSPREAERLVNPVLRRHAPDYEQAQGPLEQWAPVLYLDLILALQGQVPPGDSDA